MWWGAPHLPNSGLVKEVIRNGYSKDGKTHDCLRLHTEHRVIGNLNLADFMAYGVAPTLTANTTYTFSFYYRAASPEAVGVAAQFQAYNSGTATYFVSGKTFILREEWQKAIFTGTTGATGGTLYMYWPAGEGIAWDIAEIQLEAKSYGSSFTTGTRAKSSFAIQNPFKGTAGTMHFKAKMLNGDPTAAYKSILGNVWNNNAFLVFVDSANQVIYGYHPNTSASHSYYNFGYYPKYLDEFYITLTWSGTTFKWYLNGNIIGTHTDCDSARIANSFNELYLCSHPSYNDFGQMKDLAIYNRALTDDEVKQLCTASVVITTSGDLLARNITEEAALTNNVYYFPLNSDSMDEYKKVKPVAESNVVYTQGAAWLGTATTNYAQGTLTPYESYNTMTRNGQDLTFTMLPSGAQYLTFQNGTDYNGSIISMRGYMFKNGKPHKLPGDRANTYHTVPAIRWFFDPNTGYFEIVENCDASSPWLFHTPAGTTGSDIIEIREFQVETKRFPSPMTKTSRAIGSLCFNLYSSIGLKWNGDWTIMYWKKPVGTYDDTLTTYNIDSLGCNSNSVGGYYFWWGKASGNDQIYGATPIDITPSIFFNKWHMISLRKIGDTITITHWGVGGQNYVRTVVASGIPENAYVTQYGYDLKLNGWDNNYACNSYFKDMIVAKRALTDAEIEYIYKSQMIPGQNKFITMNEVMEEGL
jgi:hypothetical protein